MERRLGVPYIDREDWPEIWNSPDRTVVCNDDTPFSAHLRKPVALLWAGPEGGQSMVTKYFEKDVTRECLDCRV